MTAPAPPPHTVPVNSIHRNSYPDPSRASVGDPSTPRTVNMSNGSTSGLGGGKRGPMPHIKDLYLQAKERVDPHMSIAALLDMANNSCANAITFRSFGRPDFAYTEFLIAQMIIVEIIPKHKDSPAIPAHPRLIQLQKNVVARLRESRKDLDALEVEINADNARSGVQPSRSSDNASRRPSSITAKPTSRPPSSRQEQARTQDISNSQRNSVIAENQPAISNNRNRPTASPKPQRLQTGNVDALSERFARLRPLQSQTQPDGYNDYFPNSSKQSTHPHPVDDGVSATTSRPPSEYSMLASTSTLSSRSTPVESEPRKLPKMPDPTYTPKPGSVPLRPTALSRASYADHDRPRSRASTLSVSNQSPTNGQSKTVYRSSVESVDSSDPTHQAIPRRRRASTHGPIEIEITADRLYDYLKTFQVLLIDVRPREAYDDGHILATCGVCIEPTALRPNMSAEQLEESLVLSPENEQGFFARRDQFALVVYYDDSTEDASFLTGRGRAAASPLRYLYEALAEYNHDKELQRPPILLKGGITAWIDLLGPQSLTSSSTIIRPQGNGRPIARRPTVVSSDKLGIQRRRKRDYAPLDEEEEKKWRERARSESIVLDSQIQQQHQIIEEHEDNEGFQERFPDLRQFDYQHAERNPPVRPAPQIPYYPKPPSSSYTPSESSSVISQRPLSQITSAYASSQPPPIPSRPPPAIQRPSFSGVSERIVSPSSNSHIASQLPPYIPPKLKRLPRTGLHNFGVTCYMNATIQCMSATVPLTAFFLDGQFGRYIQRENWKGSKGVMPELYANLIKNLWTANDVDTLRPTNFRKFCARLNKEWGIDRQQDAKEFLEFLIDCLHEDFNVNWSKTPLRALTTAEEAHRERLDPLIASKIEWNRYLHRDHSKLTELFAGQHISRLKCTTCGFTSTTYEAFYSISVEIPRTDHPVSIYDCLRSYCSEEKLSGDEVWRCPRCKTEREATKRIIITRVPEFLVIHFKRFSASHSERARKICTPIDFPLENLDIEPFVNPLPPPEILQKLERDSKDAHLLSGAVMPPFKYDAYGVMRHIGGTLTSGHYISLVKDRARGTWREFNDSRVTDFKPEQLPAGKRLQNDQAYIVFYQRSQPGGQ